METLQALAHQGIGAAIHLQEPAEPGKYVGPGRLWRSGRSPHPIDGERLGHLSSGRCPSRKSNASIQAVVIDRYGADTARMFHPVQGATWKKIWSGMGDGPMWKGKFRFLQRLWAAWWKTCCNPRTCACRATQSRRKRPAPRAEKELRTGPSTPPSPRSTTIFWPPPLPVQPRRLGAGENSSNVMGRPRLRGGGEGLWRSEALKRPGDPCWPPSLPHLGRELLAKRLGGMAACHRQAAGPWADPTALIARTTVQLVNSGESKGAGQLEVARRLPMPPPLSVWPSRADRPQWLKGPSPTPVIVGCPAKSVNLVP